MSEKKKQRLKEYQKNYSEAKKPQCNSQWNIFLYLRFNSVCCYLAMHH